MNKEKICSAILKKDSEEISKIIKNAPERESIASLIKDLRDSLSASLELNHEISEWVFENLREVIAPVIQEYYLTSIKKHFLALGVNTQIDIEDHKCTFNQSTFEIFKHTFPVDIFSRFFANKFINSELEIQKEEEEEAEKPYKEIIERYLEIPFFNLLPNIVKIRLVSLDQRVYLSYFQEIIYGLSIRTNVNIMSLFIKEFGIEYITDIFENPKFSLLETDVWKADLLASSGRATECYWEENTIKLTEIGQKTLNLLYSPFWSSIIDAPQGLESIFLP